MVFAELLIPVAVALILLVGQLATGSYEFRRCPNIKCRRVHYRHKEDTPLCPTCKGKINAALRIDKGEDDGEC